MLTLLIGLRLLLTLLLLRLRPLLLLLELLLLRLATVFLLAEVVSGFDFLTGGDAVSLSLEESITTGFILFVVDFEDSRLLTEIVLFFAFLVHLAISASDNRCTINLISPKLSLPGFFAATVGCF